MKMGESLADKILHEWNDHDIDVVIPIPDTSRIAALELSIKLGVPYREGFIKNRYIGRTFIMPEQSQRIKSVKRKLNAINTEFAGKNVLLVDDSIVRGTTSKQIIEMAISIICLDVVPLTIESSTSNTFLPANSVLIALSFLLTDFILCDCSGIIKVLPMYLFLMNPSL